MEKTGNSIWEYACWDCWRTRLNLPRATQKNETLKRCLTCWCGECKNVKNVFFAWCCIKGLVIQGIQPPVLLLLNWPAWPNSCDRLTDTPPPPSSPTHKKFVNHLADLAGLTSYLSVTFVVPVWQAYVTSTCAEEWTRLLSKWWESWEPLHCVCNTTVQYAGYYPTWNDYMWCYSTGKEQIHVGLCVIVLLFVVLFLHDSFQSDFLLVEDCMCRSGVTGV